MSKDKEKALQIKKDVHKYYPESLEDKLQLAEVLCKSQILPESFETREQVFVALQMGQELGLKPMQAVNSIYVVNQRPSLFAKAMLAIVKNHPEYAGCEIDADEKGATVTLKRKVDEDNIESVTVTFTEEDAKRANLLSSNTYQKYPQRMYKSRAVDWAVNDLYPDAVLGLETPEAMEEITEDEEALKEKTYEFNGEEIIVEYSQKYESILPYLDDQRLTDKQKKLIVKGINKKHMPGYIEETVKNWIEENGEIEEADYEEADESESENSGENEYSGYLMKYLDDPRLTDAEVKKIGNKIKGERPEDEIITYIEKILENKGYMCRKPADECKKPFRGGKTPEEVDQENETEEKPQSKEKENKFDLEDIDGSEAQMKFIRNLLKTHKITNDEKQHYIDQAKEDLSQALDEMKKLVKKREERENFICDMMQYDGDIPSEVLKYLDENTNRIPKFVNEWMQNPDKSMESIMEEINA